MNQWSQSCSNATDGTGISFSAYFFQVSSVPQKCLFNCLYLWKQYYCGRSVQDLWSRVLTMKVIVMVICLSSLFILPFVYTMSHIGEEQWCQSVFVLWMQLDSVHWTLSIKCHWLCWCALILAWWKHIILRRYIYWCCKQILDAYVSRIRYTRPQICCFLNHRNTWF